jgi:hypothetical protein
MVSEIALEVVDATTIIYPHMMVLLLFVVVSFAYLFVLVYIVHHYHAPISMYENHTTHPLRLAMHVDVVF